MGSFSVAIAGIALVCREMGCVRLLAQAMLSEGPSLVTGIEGVTLLPILAEADNPGPALGVIVGPDSFVGMVANTLACDEPNVPRTSLWRSPSALRRRYARDSEVDRDASSDLSVL